MSLAFKKLEGSSLVPQDCTVMIVDDEADLREVLAYQFGRYGFNVLEAPNGTEAFEKIRTQKIDIVISDIQMPGGSGIELLENIRKFHYAFPVVLFITGFSEINLETAFDKGAEALFAKPFDQKVLLEAVFRALEPKDVRWKRREWRGPAAFPIEITCPTFEAARSGKVTNLGRGGIFVAIEGGIPKVGDYINFKIQFSSGTLLVMDGQGIVRWVRHIKDGDSPPGFGVEFVDLTDETRGKVIELINFLKTKQYIPRV